MKRTLQVTAVLVTLIIVAGLLTHVLMYAGVGLACFAVGYGSGFTRAALDERHKRKQRLANAQDFALRSARDRELIDR